MYSKRERKPKVWAGFEIEALSESQKEETKEDQHDAKNKETPSKSDKKSSPAKKVLDSSSTSVKKGKRRSQNLTSNAIDVTNVKVEKDKDSTDISKGIGAIDVTNVKVEKDKDSTSLSKDIGGVPAVKRTKEPKNIEGRSNKNTEKRMVNITAQCSEGFGNDSHEEVEVPKEELESMKQAVESKRTTRYIDKCERVMEKLDNTRVNNGNTSLGDKIKVESEIVKDNSKLNEGKVAYDIKTEPELDISNTGAKKKTPGRKRGRPRKSVIEDTSVSGHLDVSGNVNTVEKDLDESCDIGSLNDNTDLDESARLLSTPVSAPVKKRGRPKLHGEVESSRIIKSEDGFITPISTGKRRGRKKKSLNDTADEIDNELNISKGSGRKGRKRKEIDYAAMEENEDLNNDSYEPAVKRRGRKRKVVDYAAVNDGDDEDESEVFGKSKSGMLFDQDEADVDDQDKGSFTAKKTPWKTPSKMIKKIRCKHCDYQGKTVKEIRRHYAVSHQLWWTEENPEGSFDKSYWPSIFKLKKFLNCTKCDKLIKFVTYYQNHFEWCGREHLTYTCEHCGKDDLVLRWQQPHLKTCPALLAAQQKEKMKQDSARRKEEMKMMEGTEDAGRGKQRKAAKKAMTMVHDISKEMDPSADSDQSDDDPDVVLNDDDDDEMNNDDDDIADDDINEEDIDTPYEDDDDIVDDDDGGTVGERGGKSHFWNRANNYNPYNWMEAFVKENWSEPLFLDWLPRKQDWQQLSQQESKPYLPDVKSSIRFSFHSNEKPSTLNTLQSSTFDGFPLFYTGLSVWDLAWCPTNLNCTDGQFLAVTGKTDHSQIFLTDKRRMGPGLVQIWHTGIQNNKLKTKAVPSLQFNMVHDYGLATQMLWCPSGCYKTNENQSKTDSYTRLGLLAVCFTDGTCRIFSVPLIPKTCNEEVQTFKARPVITLTSYNDHEGGSYTCSSMDWSRTRGHSKIVLGYSSGAIKLYNLLSKSPLQLVTSNGEVRLFPYLNLQPHGNLVRAVQFWSQFENMIVTSSEDVETVFYDLTNLGAPVQSDSGSYMTTCMFSSLWQHGIFTGSDENYAVLANRARYIESGHVMFCGVPAHRKDERGVYYISTLPACIWDIECSEWLGLIVSSDNRGCISGLALKDFLKFAIDCKSYIHRQICLQTVIKEDKVIIGLKDTNKKSSGLDQSEPCKKCTNIQSEEVLHKSKSGKGQSKQSVHCNCEKTDQSTSKENLSNENLIDIEKESNKGDTYNESSIKNGLEDKKWPSYQEFVNNSVLHFKENFKVPKFLPNDKICDIYDRPSIAAIKSISFNPNKHQCCWLAYGGNTGLVRLVNIQNNLTRATQNDLRAKHVI